MCATCEDRSAPNTKFCGAAQVARLEQAYRIVNYKRQGRTYPWIAEQEGIGVATAHKLFKVGIKAMAPPGAKEEIEVMLLQLEQQYYELMCDIEGTTDPEVRVKIRQAALQNILTRHKLYGGADLNIKHTVQDKFSADIEELHKSFEEDQNIRDAARSRARNRARG